MLWFLLWTVLVLGTLAGAFFLGRRLWRSTLALGRELGRASEVLAVLADRADELARLARENAPDTGPTLFGDRDELRDVRDRLRTEREERRAVRVLDAAQGWRAFWT
ncbi:hypothetical protein KIN34_12760 [Cellulomonas sp. DKR-3]|uniref:Uncharacterized protein n=1 Tax=Cellulomonas fulva TaxID=2835530 RepID=A0ABS5U179_9CELL|nr:hypothetical protein [Cellulomonas fulva]MBT0995153.1 hypothetical protein [Cellulomonas fulva]